MRAVFDTNIYISAFAIPGGRAEDAYLHAVRRDFSLVTSPAILTEAARILLTKFDWSDGKVQEFVESVGRLAIVVKPRVHLHLLQDEPDNRILECALAGQAEYIVTGDRPLLALERYEGICVVTLAGFLDLLRQPSA